MTIMDCKCAVKVFLTALLAAGGLVLPFALAFAQSLPVVNAGPGRYVSAGQQVTLQGCGYDPNGGLVGFSWSCTGGTLSSYGTA